MVIWLGKTTSSSTLKLISITQTFVHIHELETMLYCSLGDHHIAWYTMSCCRDTSSSLLCNHKNRQDKMFIIHTSTFSHIQQPLHGVCASAGEARHRIPSSVRGRWSLAPTTSSLCISWSTKTCDVEYQESAPFYIHAI